MTGAKELFREVIEAAGLTPPPLIEPGRIARFPGAGKSNGNKSGWAWLAEDQQGGAFGDWSTGLSDTWHAKPSTTMTATEQAAHTRRVVELQRIRQEEEARARAEAAQRAQTIWADAHPADISHPYLLAKQVQPHGLRVTVDNRLIVPVMINHAMTSLQFISANGDKEFLAGGKVKGGSYTIGDSTDANTILEAEGYATGASLHQATGYPVVIAFHAGNLLPVAEQLRRQYPTATIVLCGDHDLCAAGQDNTGVRTATAAAKAIQGIVAIPEAINSTKTDWNDVHRQHGLDAVRDTIEAALHQGHYIPPDTAAQAHTPPVLAQDPNILARFEETVRVCGVVGEERCAKLVYLALTSRLLNEPVSLVIKGLSSSGKSHTTMTTVKFFPDTAVIAMTAMSSKALVYMKEEFSHRTLVLYEATALRESREKDDGDMTSYFIRSLLSEGRIVYPVTVRDKAEGFVTKTIVKEGPTNCIVTTTSLSLHGENETRMLTIPTNDTQAQTKAVMLQLARGAPQQAPDLRDWHALQLWLAQAEHRVVIPYAMALAESIPPLAVRLRRDIKSLFRLIESHAMLQQRSRAQDEHGCILATIDDYLTVRALIVDLLASGVGATVPETLRTTVQVIQKADQETGLTVREVAQQLQLDRSAAQRRLQGARDKGYVINLEDKRGRPARYALGEPLPDEVELLPTALPGYDGCAHTPDPNGTVVHSVSDSSPKGIAEPVQVCSCAGEKESEESLVPSIVSETSATSATDSVDDDVLVIFADPEPAPPPDTSAYPTFRHWVEEREQIRIKREAGLPAPWTEDPILRTGKFCNVRRRDDRVSRWVRQHIIDPYREAPYLLEWLALRPWVNWPPTMQAILDAGHNPTVQPDWPEIGRLIEARGARKAKAFGAAYNIPAPSNRAHPWYKQPKGRFVCEYVLTSLFQSRDQLLRLCEKGSRQDVQACLTRHDFFESFMAGQVVDDLTWTPLLHEATDLHAWAPTGPGSLRGLNRLAGRPLNTKLFPAMAVKEMIALRERLIADLPWVETCTLMDIQSVCCETDKYLRVLRGEGTMKARYRPETAYPV